jgi:hypothetical protein
MVPSSWMDLRYSDFYEAIYRKRKSEKEIYVIFTPGLFVYFAVYVMIRLTCSIIVINNVDEQLICIDKFGSILVSIFDRCRCFRLRSDYWNCFGKVI